MAKYLNDQQTQEFMGKLEQAGMSKDGELTPEAQQQAMEQGAEMAKADLQNDAVDAAQADPNQELLAQFGVKDVNELAERYRSATEETGKYKDMLSTLLAYQQALSTKGTEFLLQNTMGYANKSDVNSKQELEVTERQKISRMSDSEVKTRLSRIAPKTIELTTVKNA